MVVVVKYWHADLAVEKSTIKHLAYISDNNDVAYNVGSVKN